MWRPKPIHSTPSKQGNEGARPVDVARAGLENGWEATRLTPAAKSLHRKDAAPAQHGVFQTRRGNHCNSTGVIPGVSQVPSCAQAAQPASPCPAGRGPETLPAGGGPGRGAARRWRALTQATSVWKLRSLGILSP